MRISFGISGEENGEFRRTFAENLLERLIPRELSP